MHRAKSNTSLDELLVTVLWACERCGHAAIHDRPDADDSVSPFGDSCPTCASRAIDRVNLVPKKFLTAAQQEIERLAELNRGLTRDYNQLLIHSSRERWDSGDSGE